MFLEVPNILKNTKYVFKCAKHQYHGGYFLQCSLRTFQKCSLYTTDPTDVKFNPRLYVVGLGEPSRKFSAL